MVKIFYPDEVNTPKEKIQYLMDVYSIKEDNGNLLKGVIKDIALSLMDRSHEPYNGWIEDIYEDDFLNWIKKVE